MATVYRKQRPKKRRQIHCKECSAILDPSSTSYYRYPERLCKKCAKRLYFCCVKCKAWQRLRHPLQNKPRLCTYCKRVNPSPKRSKPKAPRDVTWQLGSRVSSNDIDKVNSLRTFGIEFESSQCRFVERLEGKTPFGVKYDSTVRGREFVSPILSGDAGLKVVCDFCDHARRRNWAFDETCGTHLHIGLQSETWEAAHRISYAFLLTYQTWCQLVARDRVRNDFCSPPSYSGSQYRDLVSQSKLDFEWVTRHASRYEFINLHAYRVHKTLEIRGLEGTFDKKLIANWIIAHLSFADFAANSTHDELQLLFDGKSEIEMWKNIKQHIGPSVRYLGRVRAKRISEEA